MDVKAAQWADQGLRRVGLVISTITAGLSASARGLAQARVN